MKYRGIGILFLGAWFCLGASAGDQTLEGKHGVVVQDNVDKTSKKLHYIETSDSKRYQLQGLSDSDADQLPLNKKIKVKGAVSGHGVKVHSIEVEGK